jgi:hypothetical protein
MIKDKALKMALEFLEGLGTNYWGNREVVTTAIKEALEKPEQEPLYLIGLKGQDKFEIWNQEQYKAFNNPYMFQVKTVYTSPPQREWVGLTDDDWKQIEDMPDTFDQGVAWAQARLQEKNI